MAVDGLVALDRRQTAREGEGDALYVMVLGWAHPDGGIRETP